MTTADEPQGRSMWAELRAQRDLLIEMKTKLEAVPDHELRLRHIEANPPTGPDHENRLRQLEERRFPMQTLAVLIAALALIATVVGYAVIGM